MRFGTLMVLTALALSPAVVQAQSSNASAQGTASAKSPGERIDVALETAAAAKIPIALIRSKIEEGQAKRVPQERIATAVEARVGALVRAQHAMNEAKLESRSDGELAVAADALQAGVSEKALVKVYGDAPQERRTVAIAVLTDLVRLGHASERALARVSAATRSNAGLANLQAEVAAQLRKGGRNTTLDVNGMTGLGVGRKK
jgi:hypothetical protein